MPVKCIVLPPNLVPEKKYAGQSVYRRDYSHRHRHGRRATTPTRSYTSLMNKQKKLNNDLDKMQLSDHFTTYPVALSMGYARNDLEYKSLGNIKKTRKLNRKPPPEEYPTFTNEDTEDKFMENAPTSLKKIEEAWLEEVDTGKRERGNLYGLAGKKMNLYPRKANEEMAHKKTKSLPGLNSWLSTANEYEKQVVHSFISKMSEAHHKADSSRPQSSPAGLYLNGNQLVKPRIVKNVRKNPRLISPTIDELTATGLIPKPPRTSPTAEAVVPSPPKTPPRCTESAQSRRSNDDVESNEVSTQRPIAPGNSKPSSPLYETQRPASVPASLEHNCQNCEACKKKTLKKMIDELSGKELASYDDLLDDKSHNLKAMYTQMYQTQPKITADDDDFYHHGCAFQNVKPRPKGYFTIHPEFVSENIVDLKLLRKKHEKYFGESKPVR